MATPLPSFSELPLGKNDPHHSAWGLYGKDDELGTLNRLTNETVLQAKDEIQIGIRVSLDCPLDHQKDLPFFGRQAFEKEIRRKGDRYVNDDSWSFNTQSSSQWDGLRHFGYQKEQKFYNGVTMEDIHGPSKSDVNGVHAMAKHGIIGRGILLDFESWREKHGIEIDHFKTEAIKLEHLKACAEAQGTQIKFGDILIIRSGYKKAFDKKPRTELAELRKVMPPNFAGVEQSEEMLEWIWNHFSAVAGDQPAFEAYPSSKDYSLHEVLLAGWGCPIGELFDLEELSETCKMLGRWSFFLSSKACNVPGGVASPPNIMAIF